MCWLLQHLLLTETIEREYTTRIVVWTEWNITPIKSGESSGRPQWVLITKTEQSVKGRQNKACLHVISPNHQRWRKHQDAELSSQKKASTINWWKLNEQNNAQLSVPCANISRIDNNILVPVILRRTGWHRCNMQANNQQLCLGTNLWHNTLFVHTTYYYVCT